MSFALSLPICALSGIILVAAVGYIGWPKIRVRTYNKAVGATRIMEIGLMLSRPVLAKPAEAVRRLNRAAELVVYVTLKYGSH